MEHKKFIKNEKGFTLIEIIAVIIIMGILAAVAVPKFFSMQEDAKAAAINGGLSEAAARFNHAYARFILDCKKAPTGITQLTSAKPACATDPSGYLGPNGSTTGESIGDFVVTWKAHASDANAITINVESATTIPDLSGLTTSTDVTSITWYVAP